MNQENVCELFIVKTGTTTMRAAGTRFTTLLVLEEEGSDSVALSSDPLNALDRQNLHAAAVEKSRVESVKFERLPQGLAISPGCILESEMFGDSLRVVRFSDVEITADVECA